MLNKHNQAFTLVELLVAMTITSIIVLAIHGIYKQSSIMWERAEDDAQIYHQINTVTEMLRTEISSMYFQNPTNKQEDDSEQADEETKKNDIFILTDSVISFYTSNPSNGTSPRYAKFSKVSYTSKGDKLIRTELLAAGAKTIEAPSTNDNITNSNLSFDVPKVRFEAYTENPETKKYSWTNNFKSKESIPKAIAIYFQKPITKHTKSFETKVIIECIK